MATATLESFKADLTRLVSRFRENFKSYKNLYGNYKEAEVRLEYLDPFFKALGWDVENETGKKDVVVEATVTDFKGHKTELDYLFRTNDENRFTCEAKKPIEELDDHAWQAKKYAWNLKLKIATLTDFEDFHIYVVNSEPKNKSAHQLVLKWNYDEYEKRAEEIWDLFAYEKVKLGSLEHFVRRKIGAKPVRTQTVDEVFLKELEKSRLNFGKNIFKNNGRKDVFEDNQLNENTQRILDRILFLRICEARGIDTGQTLESICDKSRHSPTSGTSAYAELTKHFQKLGKPTSGVPYFNGNIFSKHPSEDLIIDNHVLLEFIDNLSAETSPYLFEILPIEILGSIYEQFLGKELIAKGSGVAVDQKKTTVKKDTGVYYTPRYIVDYIVEQTLGKQLSEIANGNGQRPSLKDFEKQTSALKVLDPACGSGSFLIRAFERICEHWERRLKDDLPLKDAPNRAAWEKEHRTRCYIDPQRDAVFLTVGLKKKILLDNIYGVDIDSAAVEVTQLSLYLKMLEHETKTTLGKQKDLFPSDIAVLPALKDNIKCGNSLISSNFSALPEDLTRVHAFDWSVQFESIMKDGGFDTVIGNPPYILLQDDLRTDDELIYFRKSYCGASYKLDTYHLFIEQGIMLCKKGGLQSFITPSNFLTNNHLDKLRKFILKNTQPLEIVVIDGGVFVGASVDIAIFVFLTGHPAEDSFLLTRTVVEHSNFKTTSQNYVFPKRVLDDKATLFTAGIVNPVSELWDKISGKFPKLETIADVNFGKQLRDRKKFTQDVVEVPRQSSIPSTHIACVTGKNIQRYLLEWSRLACFNDTVAQKGGCWDETKHKAKGKLLTRQIGQYPSFALDMVGYHCLNTIFMVTLREKAPLDSTVLLGVLNSKLLRALWVGRFYDQRQTFPKVKGTYLKELPIALSDFSNPAEKSIHDKLVRLVDKMLDLTPKMRAATTESEKDTLQNAITATDNEIDHLVYELYGLTEDEIKLVEESSVKNK